MKLIQVKSPANIAFIKYWGQRDASHVLPFNDSFSMNLSGCYTELEIEVVDDTSVQEMSIKDYKSTEYVPATEDGLIKVEHMYNIVREYINTSTAFGYRIKSTNSFPKKAGIASSASFFSALAIGFAQAFNAQLSEKDLSILARLSGSGSASRSVPDGFVWWHAGTDSQNSFAESIAPADFWDVRDIVLILTSEEKKTGSQEGHTGAETSPLFKARQQTLLETVPAIKKAFLDKNFTAFGELVEQDAISMHSVMMTQHPPLLFWSGKTITCIKEVVALRENGIEAYYTIDAGENVHVICLQKDVEAVTNHFKQLPEVEDIIINEPCQGARVL